VTLKQEESYLRQELEILHKKKKRKKKKKGLYRTSLEWKNYEFLNSNNKWVRAEETDKQLQNKRINRFRLWSEDLIKLYKNTNENREP